MSNIELVLTDVDGTLVRAGQHEPSLEVCRAISDVKASGVEITAVTGRPHEMMQPVILSLGLTGLYVCDAGASIRDVETGELKWKKWLEPKRLRSMGGILLPHCTIIDLFPGQLEIPPDEVKLEKITKEAPYIFAFVRNESLTHIVEELGKVENISVHIGPGRHDINGVTDIQITDKNADKFHGVEALRKIVHSTREHTLAIGDSTNDIPLFQNAGVKVAMGNALQELKDIADYVVAPVEQDGFAEAMRRFVLA